MLQIGTNTSALTFRDDLGFYWSGCMFPISTKKTLQLKRHKKLGLLELEMQCFEKFKPILSRKFGYRSVIMLARNHGRSDRGDGRC